MVTKESIQQRGEARTKIIKNQKKENQKTDHKLFQLFQNQ